MQCQEKAAETLDELLETALAPKTDAVKRRGAAMGVGATVKGPAGAWPARPCRSGHLQSCCAPCCRHWHPSSQATQHPENHWSCCRGHRSSICIKTYQDSSRYIKRHKRSEEHDFTGKTPKKKQNRTWCIFKTSKHFKFYDMLIFLICYNIYLSLSLSCVLIILSSLRTKRAQLSVRERCFAWKGWPST